MNAHVNMKPTPGTDAFHRERSRCIDAFAEIEEAVAAHLMASQIRFGAECLGLRIALLQKAKVSVAYPKARLATIHGLLESIFELIDQRNDIVHAKLVMAAIGDDQKACFINAKQATCGSQIARLYTFESMRALTQTARKLAEELRQA